MTEEAPKDFAVDEIIKGYIHWRKRKEKLKAEYEAELKLINKRLEALEAWLQKKMTDDKVNSFATDAGTAFKSTVEHATVVDRESLIEFIKKNEAWHLIENRVSKSGVKAYLDEGLPIPPGVNWYTSTAVHVRKPQER